MFSEEKKLFENQPFKYAKKNAKMAGKFNFLMSFQNCRHQDQNENCGNKFTSISVIRKKSITVN